MIHGGDMYSYAKGDSRTWSAILDASANINPLGPPLSVWQAIADALPEVLHYPDPNHTETKRVLARRFRVSEESIVCANGATEAMELIVRAVRPARCVILTPAFAEYEAIAKRYDCLAIFVPLLRHDNDYVLPWEEIVQIVQSGDLLWINNPHNPTSQCFSPSEWRTQVDSLLLQGIHIILDESFLDFLPVPEDWSAIPLTVQNPNLYVVRSATKVYAIPGLRFGFAVVHPHVQQQIENDRDNWSVNVLAQAAARAAYSDTVFMEQTYSWLEQEREYIFSTWGQHARLQLLTPHAPFFMVQFENGELADQVTAVLQSQGIYLRDCRTFAGLDSSYRRIAIKQRPANERIWGLVYAVL